MARRRVPPPHPPPPPPPQPPPSSSSSATQAPPTAPQRHWAANKLALTKPDAAADRATVMMPDGRVVGAIAATAAMEEAEAGRVDAMVVSHATVSSSTRTGASQGEGNFGYSDRGPRDDFGGALPRRADRADQPAAAAAVEARRVGPARSDSIGTAGKWLLG